jgi:DNA-directed RNA polymerase specialized sigma24 family protein
MADRHGHELLAYLRRIAKPSPPCAASDAGLLGRFVRERDPAAFELLLRRHGPMVWNLCRRMLADDHEAEDVFQATWLVFVRRAAAIRRPDRLANWIYGVAHKVAIRARSQTARRRVQELEMQPAI